MTYDEIIVEVAEAVPTRAPSDMERIGRWINRAVEETSRKHTWSFLRRRIETAIASGAETVDLPGNPIYPMARLTIETSTDFNPIQIIDRRTAEATFSPTETAARPDFAVLQRKSTDQHGLLFQLQFYAATDQAYTATIDGFFYFPKLVDPNEENFFTVNHPDLIIEWTLWRARRNRKELTLSEQHMTGTSGYLALLRDAVELDNLRQFEEVVHLQPGFDGNFPTATGPVNDPWRRGLSY